VNFAHWHPHVHAIASDGAFAPDGAFIALPQLAVEPFLKLWEHKVFKLLLDEGRITPETVEQMRSWQHSGFSVDKSVLISATDRDALERLVQYVARPVAPSCRAVALAKAEAPLRRRMPVQPGQDNQRDPDRTSGLQGRA
jgi:hypothetical protein